MRILSDLRPVCGRILKAAFIETIGLIAVTLIFYGTWEIYRPAAFIFLGVVLGIPYVYLTLSGIRLGDKK